jgi:hypothetical protein
MQFLYFFLFGVIFAGSALSVILIAVARVPGRDSNRGLTVLYIYIYIIKGFVIGCHSFVYFLYHVYTLLH